MRAVAWLCKEADTGRAAVTNQEHAAERYQSLGRTIEPLVSRAEAQALLREAIDNARDDDPDVWARLEREAGL